MTYTPSVDLPTAAYRRLAAMPEFVALVTEGLVGSEDDGTVWLFQGLTNEGLPFRDPEGSGKCVVVLLNRSDWAPMNNHNTAHFPVLRVLVYADCTRDSKGAVLTRDADAKCKDVFKVIDKCFHLVGSTEDEQAWPGMRVHSSIANSPLEIDDVPSTESYTVRGWKQYEVVTD